MGRTIPPWRIITNKRTSSPSSDTWRKGELLSAEQRVGRAMSKVKEGRKFTPEQENWLQYVQHHLARNPVVDEPGLKFIPFSKHGGWEKANLVSGGKLTPLLETINVAMVTA